MVTLVVMNGGSWISQAGWACHIITMTILSSLWSPDLPKIRTSLVHCFNGWREEPNQKSCRYSLLSTAEAVLFFRSFSSEFTPTHTHMHFAFKISISSYPRPFDIDIIWKCFDEVFITLSQVLLYSLVQDDNCYVASQWN